MENMAASKCTDEGSKCSPTIPDLVLADESRSWKEKVPVGIRFKPTDEVLVGYYLAGKVSGHPDGPIFKLIKVVDFDQCEPSQLSNLTYDFGDGKIYFFTRMLEGESARRHVCGGGFWKKMEKISYVNGKNEKPIAAKTTLIYYENNKKSTPVKTQWRMKEYMLLDNQLPEQNDEDNKMTAVRTLCVAYSASSYRQVYKKNNLTSDLCKSPTPTVASDDKRNRKHSVKRRCVNVEDKRRSLKLFQTLSMNKESKRPFSQKKV